MCMETYDVYGEIVCIGREYACRGNIQCVWGNGDA